MRYLVYGVTGSGKTTLARALAARLGLPWHPVDDLMWQPGWVPVPEVEQRRIIERICAQDAWVLDHAYGAWLDVPLARADVVVALDYPRRVSFARVVRRSLARALTRRCVCGGNVETWRHLLSRESMIVWHVRSFGSRRARIRGWAGTSPGPEVVRLTSPRQARRWLAGLEPVP